MQNLSTKILIIALFLISGLQAQTLLTADFNGGLGAWTTEDNSALPSGDVWVHSTTGPSGPFLIDPIASTTAANGFALFDSDLYCSHSQNAWLISPAFDCSGSSTVVLYFEQFYRRYYDTTWVEVSNDGGLSWTPFAVNQALDNNGITSNPETIELDISAAAGGEANVIIAFQFKSEPPTPGDATANEGCGYSWQIDDVHVESSGTAVNLGISDIFFPAASFATPVSQIGIDSMGFSVDVSNLGIAAQNNVIARVEVLDESSNVLHMQELTADSTIAPGAVYTFSFPDLYPPELDEGTYSVKYSIIPENPDVVPSNNVEEHIFVVTADLFANDNGVTTALNVGGADDYAVGCNYRMSPYSADNFVAKLGVMSAATNTGNPLIGKSIDIFLLKVIDPLYFQTTDFPPNNAGLEIVGANTFEIPAGTANFDEFEVTITDFNTGSSEVSLEPGVNYILIAYYSGDNHTVFHGHSENTNYMDGGTVIFVPTGDGAGWFGGWSGGTQCQMRMPIFLATKTDNPALEASLNIYPNPTSEIITAAVNFEEAEDGMLIIANAEGKVITYREFQGIKDQTFEFNVSKYAAGNYVMRISNSKGVRTLPFVVTGK